MFLIVVALQMTYFLVGLGLVCLIISLICSRNVII